MPCRPQPTEDEAREDQNRWAANMLMRLCRACGGTIPAWIEEEAEAEHPTDACTAELCRTLKEMDPLLRAQVVAALGDRWASDLAYWWKTHREADAVREADGSATQ